MLMANCQLLPDNQRSAFATIAMLMMNMTNSQFVALQYAVQGSESTNMIG